MRKRFLTSVREGGSDEILAVCSLDGGMILSRLLICAVPNPGHFNPMFSIAKHLARVGHTVIFHTAENFREVIEASGLEFVAMTGKANIDYRNPGNTKEREKLRGLDQRISNIKYWFIESLPDQHRSIEQILRERPIDLILTDTLFFGCFPLLLGPKEKRPLIVGCGVNPLTLRSIDCGATTPPDTTPEGRRRNQEENLQIERTFQSVTESFNAALSVCDAPPLPGYWRDLMYTLPDLFLQFTGEMFEFPRSDMAKTIQFAGPLWPDETTSFKEPIWWGELDQGRPILLVTQGTFANFNLNELIQPTLSALSDDDVLVIAATGSTDTGGIVVPRNARVEAFIPFDRLLPKADIFVTNGGYGSVQRALSFGKPLVVAGESEDKAFVAARVGWTGAGINLETSRPSVEQIRTAVHSVLTNDRYRLEAERVQKSFAQYDALAEVARSIDVLLARADNTSTGSA